MPNKLSKFWQELKRRKVTRVITVYGAAAFVIIEVTNNIADSLDLPHWISKWVIILLGIGLLLSLIFSWIFDFTPEGIQKTKPADTIQEAEKQTTSNRWKIATFISIVIIIAMIVFNVAGNIKRSSNILRLAKSIAVLPFENWSYGEEFEYLGDAIANEICTRITKIQGFNVLSFTSTSSYRGVNKPSIRQIGKELGANFIIEGSVERQDEDVSIHVQVIQAKEDSHVWAEEYTGKWNDIFSLRAKIAVQIAEKLKTVLSPDEIEEIVEQQTSNPEAYNYYLKGRYYEHNYDIREMYEKAVEMYEKAVALDSSFALAYASLAIVHAILYVPKTWDHTAERLEKSTTCLEKAIELAPQDPEVLLAKGYYLEWIEKDYEQALDEFRLALNDMPNNSDLLRNIGILLLSQGKPDEAKEFFEKSYDYDPKSLNQAAWVSWSYVMQRDWAEALKWIDMESTSHPDNSLSYYRKAEIYLYGLGDLDKARGALDEGSRNKENFNSVYYLRIIETYKRNFNEALKHAQTDIWNPHNNYIEKGHILDYMGDHVNARLNYDSARNLLEVMFKESPENAFFAAALGQAYAGLGDKDKALYFGNKAVEMHPIHSDPYSSGEYILLYLAQTKTTIGEYEEAMDHLETLLSIPSVVTTRMLIQDPIYDPLRDFPRFQQLIKEKN